MQTMMQDDERICRGNWRNLVKTYEPMMGKRFRDREGRLWTFFGLVHSDDDYYFGMDRKGRLHLLSCVGSIEGCGYVAESTDAPLVRNDVTT